MCQPTKTATVLSTIAAPSISVALPPLPPSISRCSSLPHSHSLALLQCMMARARPSSSLWSLVKTVSAGVLSFGFPVRSTGLAIACGGPAMLPTFESWPGDLLLVDRRPLGWFRGDVVAVRFDDESKGPISADGKAFYGGIVSRLIALPGDLVRLRGTTELREVPEGHCWVEGDNPSQSKDSRTYGPVPLDLLEGTTVTHIVWPPRRMAAVPGGIPEERVRLLINPAGSAEEVTAIARSGDSMAPRFGPGGGGSIARSLSDSVGSYRSGCNFVWLVNE